MRFNQLRVPTGYPEQIVTLGDHLRAVGLKRSQHQKQVAEFIGVTVETILNWVQNYSSPSTACFPKIMDYLGYCPMTEESWEATLGARAGRPTE